MSRQGSKTPTPKGLLLSRLIWPMGVLFAGTLWLVFSTILWTTDSVNEITLDRERVQLEFALGQHLDGLKNRLAPFVSLTDAASADRDSTARAALTRFTEAAAGAGDFTTLAIVLPDGSHLAGRIDAAIPRASAAVELRRRLGRLLDPEDMGRVGRADAAASPLSAEILADGHDVYAGFVYRPGSVAAAQTPLLVAIRPIHPDTLQVVAAGKDVDAVTVSAPSDGEEIAGLPIRNGSGEIAAVLGWTSSRPGDLMQARLIPLTVAGLAIAGLLFSIVAGYLHWFARDLAETEARSRDILGRDPLSGLANRLIFAERLEAELSRRPTAGNGIAVLFIDLDRFKDVNDTFGHQAGDDLIRLVAQRLLNLVRSGDLIARFGGDEFAIIQTGLRSHEDAGALAKRMLDALTQPFALGRSQVIIGASIGIALAPEHGMDREALMGLADTALYKAKSEGRNRFVYFQQRMDETIRMRKLVEEDLRRAIDEDELVLHYQPLFSADGERVVAVEALVRWPHPVRGMISPGEFIPIAEERGLVIPLGEWVLRKACLDGKRWPGIRVAVNVSPLQFRHRDFVPDVLTLLETTGFDPGRLELELTEGVVVEDADAAEAAMMELRAAGIHLALDDFGTGYSSLIYLRRFAFDTIKIDRSFLESMEATGESAILVHSMVHLGRALGLTVTAEGVETREQHRFLQALGCHQLQGFFFSRPVTAEQIDVMLVGGATPASQSAA